MLTHLILILTLWSRVYFSLERVYIQYLLTFKFFFLYIKSSFFAVEIFSALPFPCLLRRGYFNASHCDNEFIFLYSTSFVFYSPLKSVFLPVFSCFSSCIWIYLFQLCFVRHRYDYIWVVLFFPLFLFSWPPSPFFSFTFD